MTLKDALRILRRRWPAAVTVFLAVFGGLFTVSVVSKEPTYWSQSRVLITPPAMLVTAREQVQLVSFDQRGRTTWASLITSRPVQTLAVEILRKKPEYAGPGAIRSDWFEAIAVAQDQGQTILAIEVAAPTAQVAVDVANAMAEATEAFSREMATRDIRETIDKTRQNYEQERRVQADQEHEIQKIRNETQDRFGVENPDMEVTRLQEEIANLERRGKEAHRQISSNRLRIARVTSDRSMSEHLRREAVPKITASAQSRIKGNSRVSAAVGRLESLRRESLVLERKYTRHHPSLQALQVDIHEAELELTEAQLEALGSDADAEELGLLTEIELMEIELRVIEPELKEYRLRLKELQPHQARLETLEKTSQEVTHKVTVLGDLLTQFETTPSSGGWVRVLDRAEREQAAYVEKGMKMSRYMMFVISLIVALMGVILLDHLDTSVRSEQDVQRHLNYPVLGVVPEVAEEVVSIYAAKATFMAEIFDTLATVMLSSSGDKPCRTFVVTSSNPGEGKTSMATNLSLALARQGKRTLLVDGDMRIPTVHRLLSLPNGAGLCELLGGQATVDTEGIFQHVDVAGLEILTNGLEPKEPYRLLNPEHMLPVWNMLRARFDTIVIDTPPVLKTGDPLKFCAISDGVIVVVQAGQTDRRQVVWTKRLLEKVNARVIGVLLNRATTESEQYYYYYRDYHGYMRKKSYSA